MNFLIQLFSRDNMDVLGPGCGSQNLLTLASELPSYSVLNTAIQCVRPLIMTAFHEFRPNRDSEGLHDLTFVHRKVHEQNEERNKRL